MRVKTALALACVLYLYELYWSYISDKILRDMTVAKSTRR